jgi:hypothetical protein
MQTLLLNKLGAANEVRSLEIVLYTGRFHAEDCSMERPLLRLVRIDYKNKILI